MEREPVTFRGMAHPWLCDVMGHMNTRHYVAMFDDASFQFLQMLGGGLIRAGVPRADGGTLGWADVRQLVEYREEVPVGTLVLVRSRLLKLGGKSITYLHAMEDLDEGRLRATMEVVTVVFDLEARAAVPLPAAFRARAEPLLAPP